MEVHSKMHKYHHTYALLHQRKWDITLEQKTYEYHSRGPPLFRLYFRALINNGTNTFLKLFVPVLWNSETSACILNDR